MLSHIYETMTYKSALSTMKRPKWRFWTTMVSYCFLFLIRLWQSTLELQPTWNVRYFVWVHALQGAVRIKFPCLLYFSWKLCALKPNKSQTKQANIMDIQEFLQYFRRYWQVVSNFSFVLYTLFILLSIYVLQIPTSTCSAGRDTDVVSTVTILCLFLQAEHHRHWRCWSWIWYSRVRPLYLPAVPQRDTDTETLFVANCYHYAGGGTPS